MNWEIEQSVPQGFHAICGIDEVGRGPLAGPVCAAAVILPFGCDIAGLDDSKKLTERKREQLFDIIQQQALAYSIALVEHTDIDRLNILEATFLAMQKAVAGLQIPADYALVDGNRIKGLAIPSACIIGGDAKSPSIAAASILAKVTRDRLMLDYAAQYPEYHFEKHKGYGTKAHYEAILTYGACPIHRQTFLRKFYAKHPELTEAQS